MTPDYETFVVGAGNSLMGKVFAKPTYEANDINAGEVPANFFLGTAVPANPPYNPECTYKP